MTGETGVKPPAPKRFPAVADLGRHGRIAAEKLQAVHEKLVDHDAAADAERLIAVNQAAAQRDLPMLERLVERERRLDQLEELQHRKLRRVVSARNATALLPLVITWLLLGWSSILYQQQLNDHPELAPQPFLSLWQTRFGGQVILTFAETALTTVVLILTILVLTFWAHRTETSSGRVVDELTGLLDEAMDELAAATADTVVQPPVTAQEWAEAAQEILLKTQESLHLTQATITAAMNETKELAETNQRLSADTQKEMAELQLQARTLVADLAREVRDTLSAVREDNTQFIVRTTREALGVLEHAVTDNRQLVEQQMTPLFDGFRESLKDYRADHQVYRAAATEMATRVTGLSESAAVIATASTSHADAAKAIDRQLELIKESQTDLVTTVGKHSANIESAATSLSGVATLLSDSMRTDLETLTRDVVLAGKRIADADVGLSTAASELAKTSSTLTSATSALSTTAGALQGAAIQLATVAATGSVTGPAHRPSRWRRLLRMGGGA